jgi:hypothetical protein
MKCWQCVLQITSKIGRSTPDGNVAPRQENPATASSTFPKEIP